jgi:hypothetical protein
MQRSKRLTRLWTALRKTLRSIRKEALWWLTWSPHEPVIVFGKDDKDTES